MNGSIYCIVIVIGFAIAKAFECLLEKDKSIYADMTLEIMQTEDDETDK